MTLPLPMTLPLTLPLTREWRNDLTAGMGYMGGH